MGLKVRQIAVGGYDDNFSYLIYDTESKHVAIVDPCGDLDLILETTDELELTIVGIFITHTHFDHIEGIGELLRSYAAPVYVHERGQEAIVSSGPITLIKDADRIRVGGWDVEILYTPGHIGDAVCYYIPAAHAADGVPKIITGDTLFVGGCGRTNAVGVRALYDSLQRLKALPPETEVYPGHDYGSRPHSTIAWELEHNKYFLAKNFEHFEELRLT